LAGVFLDQPHLSYSNRHLIVAFDASDKGRVVIRIRLSAIAQSSIGWEYIGPLTVGTDEYQFSAPASDGPTAPLRAPTWRGTSTRASCAWLPGTTPMPATTSTT